MQTISGTHTTSAGIWLGSHWAHRANSQLIPPYSAIGWIKNGELVGVAVFIDYRGSNIEIHLQGKRIACKRCIREVYEYVFIELGCNRLTARIKDNNKNFLHLLPRLGFEYEGSSRAYYGPPEAPEDAHNYVLFKPQALDYLDRLYAQRTEACTSS